MIIKEGFADLMLDATTKGLLYGLKNMPLDFEPYKHVATFRYCMPTGTTKEEFIKNIKTPEGYEIIDVKEFLATENGEEKRYLDVIFTNTLPVKVYRHYDPETKIIIHEKIGVVAKPAEDPKTYKKLR